MHLSARRKITVIGFFHIVCAFASENRTSVSFVPLGGNGTVLQDLSLPGGIFTDINAIPVDDPLLALVSLRKCTFDGISAATQVCEMLFFLELKSDEDVICSKVYNKLQRCILSKSKECTKTNSFRATVKRSVKKSLTYYLQAGYCNDGSLSLTKLGRPINYCSVEYNEQIGRCYGDYHLAFRRNINDESLCEKYADAKSCAQRAESEMCTFRNVLSAIQKISANINRCWNPFCTPEVTDFDVEITRKGLSFDYLRKLIQSKLEMILREFDASKSYQDSSQLKRGVSTDCRYNKAALISTALNEIIKELNSNEVNDQPTIDIMTNPIPKTLPPNAVAELFESHESGHGGNGCESFFLSYSVATGHILLALGSAIVLS